jgi:putative ABC transport system permease protein
VSDSSRAGQQVDWATYVRPRLASLRLSPAREAEIVDELSQHLDDRRRELLTAGVAPDQATHLALAEFTDADTLARYMAPLHQSHQTSPVVPGVHTGNALADLWRDLRYAARTLRRQPGFAAATVLTLALAIGATTAIFTVVDATLLRPLPFPQPDRLVQIGRSFQGDFGSSVSPPKFLHWRREGRTAFADIAACSSLGSAFSLVGSGTPERVPGALVSATFFDVMGVRPLLGRAFREDEDLPGGPRVVVLSHAFWKSRFGANPEIVGRAITLNTVPYTVIGVMPEGFRYPDVAALWTLFQFDPASQERAHNFEVVARLKGETTMAQARASMEVAGAALKRASPGLMGDDETVAVRPLRDRLYGDMRQALLILLVSAAFVLLVGCVNVANLQLAQAAGRQHEIALRVALGASMWTVARQLLVEGVLLAVIGGLAGVAIASAGVLALLALSPVHVPYAEGIAVSWRVLAFALALSLVTGLATGLLPAVLSARPDLDRLLRAGAHRTIGQAGRWTRRTLVAGEVACALVLVICAFLLVKSLAGLLGTHPGFVAEHVLTMKVALPEARYGSRRAMAQFQEQVEQRLVAVPGVRAAAVALLLPLQLDTDMVFAIEGRYVPGTETGVGWAQYRAGSPGYFDALQIPLRRGRVFTARDRADSLPVVVINEAAAARIWPGADPLGQRITLGQPSLPDLADTMPREIVGIVGDVRDVGMNAPPVPTLYVPLAQQNDLFTALAVRLLAFSVVVRGDGRPADLARSAQQAIWSVDPQQPVSDVRPMGDVVAQSLGPQRFNTTLLGALAVLALVLAAIGLYGTVAHIVSQQTREIGVRMALGATRSSVVGLVLRQALSLVAAGVAVGTVGALGATRALQTLLTDISTSDPWVFVLAPALMFVVAVAAALRPALRAAGVDPVSALRAE